MVWSPFPSGGEEAAQHPTDATGSNAPIMFGQPTVKGSANGRHWMSCGLGD